MDISVGYLHKDKSKKPPKKYTLITDKSTGILSLLNLCPWRRNDCIFYLQIIVFQGFLLIYQIYYIFVRGNTSAAGNTFQQKQNFRSNCCGKRPSVFIFFGLLLNLSGKNSHLYIIVLKRGRESCIADGILARESKMMKKFCRLSSAYLFYNTGLQL